MVDHELANAGGTCAVETDAGQVGRVSREDEVTVGCAVETDNDGWVDAQGQANRSDCNEGGSLGVNQLGNDEQHDCVCPWRGLHDAAQVSFEGIDVGLEECISHPGNTEDGEYCRHAGLEHRNGGDLLVVDVAENEDNCTGDKHDHLNDKVHREDLHLTILVREGRAQDIEAAEDDDDCDGGQEYNDGALGGGWEDLVE